MLFEIVFGLILLIAAYLDWNTLKVGNVVSGALWLCSLAFPIAIMSIFYFGLMMVVNAVIMYCSNDKYIIGFADILIVPLVASKILLGNVWLAFAMFIVSYGAMLILNKTDRKPMIPLLILPYFASLL